MTYRRIVKRLFPFLIPLYHTWQSSKLRRRFAGLTVAETFARIYETKAWGPSDRAYCSGVGSAPEFGLAYAEVVNDIIRTRGVRRVVDLGCGDFAVGNLLTIGAEVSYLGIDIVPGLIEYNAAVYGRPGIEFRCANIIEDDLPEADLCLIRQVLQHLSNDQVSRILEKCSRFPVLVVTEDVYTGPGLRPNVDKPHGPDARADFGDKSGVYLDLPPFELPARTILEVPWFDSRVVRTVLIERDSPRTVQSY